MNERMERSEAMLPPPELLSRYKEMGLGQNLIELVKEEQKHRHDLQKKYLMSYRIGQMFGLFVTIFFLNGIFSLAGKGLKKEAYVLAGIFSCLTLFIAFLVRKNKNAINKKKAFHTNNVRYNNHNNFSNRKNGNFRR